MFKLKLITINSNLKQSRFLSDDLSKLKSKIITNKLFKSDELKDDQTYISTSHPKSMLRFYRNQIRDDETLAEKEYRLKYEQVQLWNHNYWLKNNEQFTEGKKQFKNNLNQIINDENQDNDLHQQEQLLPFYKEFLNTNHKRNINYNMEWYKKNLGLLRPAILAILSRFIKNLKS